MADYSDYLLEFIAWCAAPGNREFDDWRRDFKEKFDASNLNRPAPVHGDVRTHPAARTGQVSVHDPKPDARLRHNLGEKLAEAKVEVPKK